MKQSEIQSLIERVGKATGPDREIDCEIWNLLYPEAQVLELPRDHYLWTSSLDAAMTLLPKTATNHHLISFVGHGRKEVATDHCWAFSFSDTEMLMGKRAATEQIARMEADYPAIFGRSEAKAPMLKMERAIAEHFMVFNATHAATPALAVCEAALLRLINMTKGE